MSRLFGEKPLALCYFLSFPFLGHCFPCVCYLCRKLWHNFLFFFWGGPLLLMGTTIEWHHQVLGHCFPCVCYVCRKVRHTFLGGPLLLMGTTIEWHHHVLGHCFPYVCYVCRKLRHTFFGGPYYSWVRLSDIIRSSVALLSSILW